MTVAEAAAFLHLNKNSVYFKARSGRLPATKIGGRLLIDRHRLNRMLELKRRPLLIEMRQVRGQWRLSLTDLSERTGIPAIRLQALEDGLATPRVSELEKIWSVLGQYSTRQYE